MAFPVMSFGRLSILLSVNSAGMHRHLMFFRRYNALLYSPDSYGHS